MNLNKTEIELIQYCLNHTLESLPWSYYRYYPKYTEKEDLKKLKELEKKVNKLQTKLSNFVSFSFLSSMVSPIVNHLGP